MTEYTNSGLGKTPMKQNTTNAAQVVVVTGGGSGFGAALAEALVARGASVVIAGRDRQRLESVCVDADPVRLARVVCDVSRAEDLDQLWRESIARFGKVDHWLNNAGIGMPRRDLAATDPADLERVITTNLIGALLGARCALRGLLAQGHGQVWLTEGLGSNGPVMKGTAAYSASKAGANPRFSRAGQGGSRNPGTRRLSAARHHADRRDARARRGATRR